MYYIKISSLFWLWLPNKSSVPKYNAKPSLAVEVTALYYFMPPDKVLFMYLKKHSMQKLS
jgi:hypothetical protein